MNLLIIGASGFVGKSLIKAGKENGYRIIPTYCNNIQEGFIKFDILSDNILSIINDEKLSPSDTYVIICSAVAKLDTCYMKKEMSYQLNVVATKKLMNVLYENGFKFGFISSDAVFDGKIGYYTEQDETTANTEYGKQKAEIEHYIQKNMSSNLIFRISIMLDDEHRKGNILSEFYNACLENKTIYCVKNRIFCPTYVKDVVNVMILCFEKGLSGLYHIINKEIYSRRELAELFVKKSGYHTHVEEKEKDWFAFKDNRHDKTCLVSEKIQKDVPYDFTSTEEVIDKFLNTIRKL